MLQRYAKRIGITDECCGPHAARATAATNVLDQDADIAKVQKWLATRTSAPPASTTIAVGFPRFS